MLRSKKAGLSILPPDVNAPDMALVIKSSESLVVSIIN